MSDLHTGRVRAVVRKELRDYRRKRSIVVTMAVLPLVFLIEPVVAIFAAPGFSSAAAASSPDGSSRMMLSRATQVSIAPA